MTVFAPILARLIMACYRLEPRYPRARRVREAAQAMVREMMR